MLPERDVMLTTPPVKRPNSALLLFVCTRNSSTASGLGVNTTMLPYAASKAGLLSATYYLAKELGPHKIRVNTVVPSWMWGPPVEGYVKYMAETQGVPPAEVIEGITKDMPLGEIPADDDVAEVVVFFASERARMITGQSLLVNAGELMR